MSHTVVVTPGHVAEVEIYSREQNLNGLLVVICGKKDHASDVFVFPTPHEGDDELEIDSLMSECQEHNFVTQVGDGAEFLFDTHTREGEPHAVFIGHSVTLAPN